MKVLKFGGTSVGSAQRMKDVCRLITDGGDYIVVLSAMSGTTNSLIQISESIRQQDPEAAIHILRTLDEKNKATCLELGIDYVVRSYMDELMDICRAPYTPRTEKQIVSYGEIISTTMVCHYLQNQGFDAVLMPALDYMRLDANGEPDMNTTKALLEQSLSQYGQHKIIITQGFICRDEAGRIDNLKRGGSDYTASIIGGLLEVEEIQIWTDIDGMHNNDPRYVENTRPVPQLSFAEAAELAYYGAKILHPTCILPAKMHNVPVRVKNTMSPDMPGTLINNDYRRGQIEAIAAKDGIAAVRVISDRMLMAYGFLKRVFAVFDKYKTSIDLITTSEVAVSMTIDNLKYVQPIIEELKTIGTVTMESNLTIISVVGDLSSNNIGFESRIIHAMQDIPLRMISYGGSDHNISLLVRSEDKVRALRSLSQHLFE